MVNNLNYRQRLNDSNLKLNFSQYPSIHTNYIVSHCTTLLYNQGSTLTFKSTCPIGQRAWESYLPPFLTSCPIHGAAADSENMAGGSICHV